jgi:hypothetical protein
MRKREECIGCWWKSLRERGHWGEPDVDGRIILRWISERWGSGGNRIELAQDTDRCRALLSTAKNFGFHIIAGNFLNTCKDWLASK